MLQAIETKYLPSTNHNPSECKASAAGGSVSVEWDWSLDNHANNLAAAKALAEKLEWAGTYHGGVLKNGNHVFVCATGEEADAFEL